ncbi:MAG: biotin/lipoyl-containing protein [Phycisphaeraceae bacterium]
MKLLITVQGVQYEVDVQVLEEGETAAPAAAAAPAQAPASGAPVDVPSPIAGSVLDVKVKPGDTVQANDPLLVLEAMKMESVVYAPQAGTVREVLVKAGDNVKADQVLVRI